jgi:hypothetical protein
MGLRPDLRSNDWTPSRPQGATLGLRPDLRSNNWDSVPTSGARSGRSPNLRPSAVEMKDLRSCFLPSYGQLH